MCCLFFLSIYQLVSSMCLNCFRNLGEGTSEQWVQYIQTMSKQALWHPLWRVCLPILSSSHHWEVEGEKLFVVMWFLIYLSFSRINHWLWYHMGPLNLERQLGRSLHMPCLMADVSGCAKNDSLPQSFSLCTVNTVCYNLKISANIAMCISCHSVSSELCKISCKLWEKQNGHLPLWQCHMPWDWLSAFLLSHSSSPLCQWSCRCLKLILMWFLSKKV